MAAMELTRTHRMLIGVVVAGAVVIAAIGFTGSYAAVRELAEKKGFGEFSLVFPIGIDAGICVLLALDLLLTWIRIPFPLLRQSAWILTAATIAFNGAAAWPDPLGVGMHAVIPLLFIVSIEAARHAVGRIADITADKHMEGVRVTRWLLSPVPTFMLWRRMKLWELRSYEQVIKLEQDRLIYQARLQSRFGRNWRRKAPVEALMPLRLAKYGVPLADTAAAGLAAAGVEPALLPPAPTPVPPAAPSASPAVAELPQGQGGTAERAHPQIPAQRRPEQTRAADGPGRVPGPPETPGQAPDGTPQPVRDDVQHGPAQEIPRRQVSPWFAAPKVPEGAYEGGYNPTYAESLEPAPVRIPSGPGRSRPLGGVPGQRTQEQVQQQDDPAGAPVPAQEQPEDLPAPSLPDDLTREEAYYGAFRKYISEYSGFPNARQFGLYLLDLYGVTGRNGGPLSDSALRPYVRDFPLRYQAELDEHIA
ncbi:DUF2637 domain-containing protein [Streptomyces sp. NPDC051569]|uniref:DUF2637 domain-containing protein n=1 Tax=Streptomyces sp. NPDC051569 TaxID=3365661 RepID=UPI0037AF1577